MKRKNSSSEFFTLSWKKFVISALIFIAVFFFRIKIIKIIFESLKLYNFVYYGFSILIPLYLLISFFYTILIKKTKKKVKSKKTKNNFDKFFLLSWRKVGILLISWIVSVVIHNFGSALISNILNMEFEEPFFFIIAIIVIPVYFIISVVYSLIKKLRKTK